VSRPVHVWLAFGAAFLVVLGVVGWITATALRLDRAEADGRRLAAAEESVRLALWRMDSAVAPILAREGARPYFAYQAFYPAERAYTRMFSELAAGEVLMPSPLLARRPEHVVLHFQISPGGDVSSPQVPAGRMRRLAEARYAAPGEIAEAARRLEELRAALDREALVALLGPAPAGAPIEPALAPATPAVREPAPAPAPAPAPVPATQRAPPPGDAAAPEHAAVTRQAPPAAAAQAEPPRQAPPEPAALRRAEEEQTQRSSLEWLARSKAVAKNSYSGAKSARSEAVDDAPRASSSWSSSSSSSARSPALLPQQGKTAPDVQLAPPPGAPSPAQLVTGAPATAAPPLDVTANRSSPPPVPAPPTRRERAPDLHARHSGLADEPMRSAWLGGRLLLVRRVHLDDGDWIQGCWLDWDGLRSWLTDDVEDLLPAAAVEPAPGAVPGERMLASIPARLLPGDVPVPAAPRSPVRGALSLAWTGLLLASVAVALLVRGTLALSERRAAFVSAVTHELRSPLTTFRMYADMLALGMVRGEEDRRSYLETLQRESARLSHLVENVLAYGRVERGRRPGRAEPLAVAELLDRHGVRLRERVEAAGLELAVDVAPVRVRADAPAVEQILFNLVDNACKYAGRAADRRVHLGARRAGGRVELSVRDHGPGIAGAEQRRLFVPFSRSAEAAAGSAPGVGLGLALCRQLARSLGGDLRYRDAEGGGAELVLTLPAA
jgi:signal transduction histidine kinase